MNVEMANSMDETILNDVLNLEKYEWIKSYDIHVKMFYKYGKYDKEGNLKTPALVKNGIAIPVVLKIVSSFNRLTDDVDVKIIINKDLWDELSKDEKTASLDNVLNYLELKTDKIGEPLPISEDNDKVQLKIKHPDFYCEGFVDLIHTYGKNYIPWQDADSIAKNIVNAMQKAVKEVTEAIENKGKTEKVSKKKKEEPKEVVEDSLIEDNNQEDEVNLDDIKI